MDQSSWWDEGIGVKYSLWALELSILLAISLVTDRLLQKFYHKLTLGSSLLVSKLYINDDVSSYELRVLSPATIALTTQVKPTATKLVVRI